MSIKSKTIVERRTKFNPLYRLTYRVISHSIFSHIFLVLIIINFLIIALDRYPIEKSESAYLGKY